MTSSGGKSYAVLLVQHRRHYGLARIYPANDLARKLVDLLGLKTFRELDLKKIENMGYTIDWLPEGMPEPKENL